MLSIGILARLVARESVVRGEQSRIPFDSIMPITSMSCSSKLVAVRSINDVERSDFRHVAYDVRWILCSGETKWKILRKCRRIRFFATFSEKLGEPTC